MTLMIVFLLAMNLVLATGLGMLWLRSYSWCEKSMELEERLEGRMQDLEARVVNLETAKTVQEPAAEESESWIQKRLQTREARKVVPERYKLAVNMAGSGMDLHKVAETIGISPHEAEQMVSLARLAESNTEEDVLEPAAVKESEPK
ncbi:MAG: hypothetical protein R6V55_16945 [Desulfovermiculus sp.]